MKVSINEQHSKNETAKSDIKDIFKYMKTKSCFG